VSRLVHSVHQKLTFSANDLKKSLPTLAQQDPRGIESIHRAAAYDLQANIMVRLQCLQLINGGSHSRTRRKRCLNTTAWAARCKASTVWCSRETSTRRPGRQKTHVQTRGGTWPCRSW